MRLNTSKVGLSSSPNGSGSTSPTPAGWTAATHFGIWDGGTNFIYGGALTVTPKTVAAGETAKFAIGAISVTA